MNENFDAFDEYAMKYDFNEKMIEYKYNHSYRVTHQAEEIARDLELESDDKDLASLIGLLHDIARFRQWSEYKTFSDSDSIDHGDDAVKILFEENEIKKYIAKKEEYDIIKTAIKNHNKCFVDFKSMNKREELHTKIIRDADKIDILYAFSTNRLLELVEDDAQISEEVHDEFMAHTQVLKSKLKSKNDRILMLVGLVFDLNYDYSKERVLNEKYLDNILHHLKNKKLFKPYIEEAKKYLKEGK